MAERKMAYRRYDSEQKFLRGQCVNGQLLRNASSLAIRAAARERPSQIVPWLMLLQTRTVFSRSESCALIDAVQFEELTDRCDKTRWATIVGELWLGNWRKILRHNRHL